MREDRSLGPRPLVSINIPCYRQLPQLRSCLASVLAQTLEDFEINLLDDGGSDEYREYAESLADSRVRYHRNAKRLGAMRNIFQAIFAGEGKYSLAFHEDDLLEPLYLETVAGILESHTDCGFVGAEVYVSQPRSVTVSTRAGADGPAYDMFTSPSELVRGILGGLEPMFGSIVYRRSALVDARPDHDRFGTLMDRPFLLSLLPRWSAAVIREPLVWYRVHNERDDRHGGMSSSHILELLKTYRAALGDPMQSSDEALFYSYAANWLRILYRLTPDSQKPAFGRFLYQAWRDGVYNPRWERRFGIGRIRRAFSPSWTD